MDDLISRQEALKKLAVYIHLIDKTMGKGTLTDDDCMEAAKSVLGEDELPAVQPDHNADSDKKVSISCAHENDVISREAAIDALARMMPRSYTPDGSHPADEEIFRAQEVFADCIEALEILPPAQPEIIRCKDCDWWTKQEDSVQGRCELMQMYPGGGWYCGNARRRPK